LPATSLIDQAIFKINADLRISALEKPLNLTEKRLVHNQSELLPSSSRVSN
jgi:hypothetical protein